MYCFFSLKAKDTFEESGLDYKPDEEYLEAAVCSLSSDDNDKNWPPLPLKKRKSGAAMTKEVIKAAKRVAYAAKPGVEIKTKKLRRKELSQVKV